MPATTYKIDILKNEMIGAKGLKINQTIYLAVFLFIAIFFVIYNFSSIGTWKNYPIALFALFGALRFYLELAGKWIYKRYISININYMQWQRGNYNFAKLRWSQISEINIDHSSVNFLLLKGRTKHLSFKNISIEQIAELKKKLKYFSSENGIRYISI